MSPLRLEDVIFSGISIKQCRLRFGPLISRVILTWRNVPKSCTVHCPRHLNTPIFNNNQLLIGWRPIVFPQWKKKGIHVLGDIYTDMGLHLFQDLTDLFDLPGTSLFFLFATQNCAQGSWGSLGCTVETTSSI